MSCGKEYTADMFRQCKAHQAFGATRRPYCDRCLGNSGATNLLGEDDLWFLEKVENGTKLREMVVF